MRVRRLTLGLVPSLCVVVGVLALAAAPASAAVPSPSLRVEDVKATSATFAGILTRGKLGRVMISAMGKVSRALAKNMLLKAAKGSPQVKKRCPQNLSPV